MYDVAIIGAGVIGSSIAREISRYDLKAIVLEKGADVSVGASKANSGIVHGGYSEKAGTLKAKFNILGQKMFEELAEELEFPFNRCGSLVVCFNEDEIKELEKLKVQGESNNILGLKILNKQEVHKLEPNLSNNVYSALYVPSGGIVSPYGMTIAFAENAATNGVKFEFNYNVENIRKTNNIFLIESSNGNKPDIKARVLINAAGVYSDKINNMLSKNKLTIKPRLGEYILLDTTEGSLVNRTIFQLPSKMGKGVLISPTMGGVILLGPTSIDVTSKDDVSTTLEGFNYILNTASLSVGNIKTNKIITSFSGLRAHSTRGDFIIEESDDVPNLINLCGIGSPGLTAAPAIAKEIETMVVSILKPSINTSFNPKRKQSPYFIKMSNEEKSKFIEKNKDYGKVICRCELVTKGEIIDALRSPLKIKDVDSIKRRTRIGMGRCQGGFCNMKVLEVIAEELDMDISEVTKFGGNSKFLVEKNKESLT